MHQDQDYEQPLVDATRDDFKLMMREAVKEAAGEWLDDKFRTFGKWSMRGLAAAGLTALVYFFLFLSGWHK